MTQVFDDVGNLVSVTVMRIDPNVVIAQKTKDKDGYAAVVLGMDDLKPIRQVNLMPDNFRKTLPPKEQSRNSGILRKRLQSAKPLGLIYLKVFVMWMPAEYPRARVFRG